MLNSTATSNLSRDNADLLESNLDDDERVFWADQPNPGRLARASLLAVPFGLFFAGVPIVMITAMILQGAPWPMILFPCLFIVVGLLIASSPIWAYKKAHRIVYAVTEKRAIILTRGFSDAVELQNFDPGELISPDITRRGDGGGDIVFETRVSTYHHKGRTRHRTQKIGFLALNDVRTAEKFVKALVDSAAE